LQDNGAVDSHYAFIRPAPTANPWRKSFYDEDHDFGDYSRHFTRTAAANRNSAAAPPPSGPYFAYEWKEMNQVDDLIPGSSSAQLGWNSLDYYDYLEAVDHAGNRYHPEQFYPPLTYKRPGLIRDQGHRKPTALTNHRVNPNMQHGMDQQQQQHQLEQFGAQFQQHQLQGTGATKAQDKVSSVTQSLASAYPNGVMGAISLVAGIVWFLVNKSATPVVKMRSDDEYARAAQFPFDWTFLASIQDPHCRKRAACDLVNERPSILPFTTMLQSMSTTRPVEDLMKSLTDEETYRSVVDLFTASAFIGDCSQLYPNCSDPIPIQPRDRR